MTTVHDAPPLDVELASAEPQRRSLLRTMLVVLIAVGCLLVVYLSPLHGLLLPSGVDGLRAWLASFGSWSAIVFLLLCGGGVAIGAPRLAFSAAAGLLFGVGLGVLLAQAGTLLGCLLAFSWARRLGGTAARARGGRRLQRLIRRVERHPILTNVMLRVFPVGNNLALNVLFALSPLSLRDYLIGTFLGTLPATVVYALFGSSAHSASTTALLTGTALLLLLALVSTVMLRRSPGGLSTAALPDEDV
jgi:uncharacterized membrane protein YdjX (TVP38/TMEM64 family)